MKKISTRIIAFIGIGIALNFVGANIALLLHLPIYLDSIGTILTGVLFGPIAGMLTGGLSALLTGLTTDIFSLYFSPVQLITGLLAGLLVAPQQRVSLRILWQGLALSLPGTIVSSFIAVGLFGGVTSSGSSLIVQVLSGLGLNKVMSTIVVQIGTDYLDRCLSLLLVLLVAYRFLQRKKTV